jgi:hypothetical protein
MKERFKVLCVGVNKVLSFNRLNYAERDAETLAKYFETLKEKADVTLLTAKNATREKILAWVKECSAIQEELTVILFFAGHGSAEKNDIDITGGFRGKRKNHCPGDLRFKT